MKASELIATLQKEMRDTGCDPEVEIGIDYPGQPPFVDIVCARHEKESGSFVIYDHKPER